MSKRIKKNLAMVVSLAVAGVLALGLLVYMLILFFEWSEYRARTEAARNEVQAMVNQKPAPGKENEARIQKDIELYQEKSKDMVDTFKSPLRPAVDAFLAELPPPQAKALTDEEKDYYKVPDTGIEGDDETPAVPLKIRKFSYDDFRKFFQERFEKFCSDRNYSEDADRISLNTLNEFRSQFVNLFPAGSWKKAMDKFYQKAITLTYEPIDEADPLPALLVGFGMPRRVSDNAAMLAQQVDEIINLKIKPMAARSNLVFEEGALNFVGGFSKTDNSSNVTTLAMKDYPYAFFHWDVFGDIVNRLCQGNATSLHKVILRTASAESSGEGEGGGNNSNSLNFEGAYDQDGNFRLYHYTVVFSGSMESVRKVLKTFDSAWKDRRMYLVRGIALYASDNGAARVMKQQTEENKEERNSAAMESNRPVRRRRRIVAEGQPQEEQAATEEKTEMTKEEERELHYRVILQREQDKVKNNKPADEELLSDELVTEFLQERVSTDAGSHNKEEKDGFFADFEKRFKPHLRFGYRKVLIGEAKDIKHCLVYLDIDYVVLEQNE